MENHISIGSGGHTVDGGRRGDVHIPYSNGSGGHTVDGGRGGDVHIHYSNNTPGSYDISHLMGLPRALYAAHDSLREDGPSPCLQGTRVGILEEILKWSESPSGERPPVYWLSGLPGIGKSTIAKTVAERAQEKAILGATFFFSRGDHPSRDPGLVLPTLAFQLAQSDSAFKEVIVEALRQDPTVGRKGLLSQLQELILTPLLNINPRGRPLLIVLDALDECEEQGAADILQLVFTHLIRIPFLRILITSRPQPHLASVFNNAPDLEKMVLHDIEASVVQQDIRLYISTELAKIPEKLDLEMPGDWATEAERDSLVEKSGKLFVYAATAIRFIGDDHVRDPPRHLRLVLSTQSLRQAAVTPHSQLDDLYMEVLNISLSSYNPRPVLERFQIIIGSIVLLREPLPLHSLAEFVQHERQVVEDILHHLHSVIIPPHDIHEAPRIYHSSFLEFITDPSRCSMVEFVIVSVPDQELRHAIRCFGLMARYLKRDVAGISDPSLLNWEVDGFVHKVRTALSPEVQYACRYWASHLSHVEYGEKRMVEALEVFSMWSILWWLEAMSLIGSLSTAVSSIQEAYQWAISSKCKPIIVAILSDTHHFLLVHDEVIRMSALHVYHSALPFTPHTSALYKAYHQEDSNFVRVIQGVESGWPGNWSNSLGHDNGIPITEPDSHPDSVTIISFSPDGLHLASGSSDGTLCLWNVISGMPITELVNHSNSITTIAFSSNGSCLASGSNDGTLCLWNAVSGILIMKLANHSNCILTVAFSPDGSYLASGSDDGTLGLWDGLSGMPLAELAGPSNPVTAVAFSPDGSWLASGLDDGTLCLWDVLSGVPIAEMGGHSHSVMNLRFSPEGLYLASSSLNYNPQLRELGDPTSDAVTPKSEGPSHWLSEVAFSIDGSTLLTSAGVETFTWDLLSQPPHHLLPGLSTPPGSTLGLTTIWSLHGRWIQVQGPEDDRIRRICYIPPHYSIKTHILMSRFRIAFGCDDGRVIILAIVSDSSRGWLGEHTIGWIPPPTAGIQPSPLLPVTPHKQKHPWAFPNILRRVFGL